MEHGSIQREIHIDASPDVVFDVVSRPEHIGQWWSDEADFAPVPGATGDLRWGNGADQAVAPITVVQAEPPLLFSFRWVYPDGEAAAPGNSLLVTFELTPSGAGTLLRLTETGFREMGWEAAVLEAHYADHVVGWDTHLASVAPYVARLVSAS